MGVVVMSRRNRILSIAFGGILVTAVVVVIVALTVFMKDDAINEDTQTAFEWWQQSIIYEIYPASFKDSNGDGIGDLNGITSKLDYFVDIGVGGVWITPFYESPMLDNGYDVSNYRNVNPIFGTIDDFRRLVKEAHAKGIRVIIDLVPNHSSNQHEWFVASENGDPEYTDYYIWRDGKTVNGTLQPPNNWLSKFGGESAWTYSDKRRKFYYHQYLKEQPDLNYRNEKVRREMEDVIRYWMDTGIDGFRIDAIPHLFEDQNLYDEPVNTNYSGPKDQYGYLVHNATRDLNDIGDVFKLWSKLVAEYGSDKFLVAEAFSPLPIQIRYYGYGCSLVFRKAFMKITRSCDGRCVRESVEAIWNYTPPGKWTNYVMGSHDNARVSSSVRMGREFVDAMNMLILTLRGTPFIYYGEEIGMENTFVSYEHTKDQAGKKYGPVLYVKHTRDPERTPMQWSGANNAGFSTNSNTYLPINDNYPTINVQAELANRNSHLSIFERLAKIRQEPPFVEGSMEFVETTDSTAAYVRQLSGHKRYVVAINFGRESTEENLSGPPVNFDHGKIVITTEKSQSSRLVVNETISLENVRLGSGQGLVIEII